MSAAVRAVLWDADGVLQSTPRGEWDLAVRVVEQFPGALEGEPLDEDRIRAAAAGLGLILVEAGVPIGTGSEGDVQRP